MATFPTPSQHEVRALPGFVRISGRTRLDYLRRPHQLRRHFWDHAREAPVRGPVRHRPDMFRYNCVRCWCRRAKKRVWFVLRGDCCRRRVRHMWPGSRCVQGVHDELRGENSRACAHGLARYVPCCVDANCSAFFKGQEVSACLSEEAIAQLEKTHMDVRPLGGRCRSEQQPDVR